MRGTLRSDVVNAFLGALLVPLAVGCSSDPENQFLNEQPTTSGLRCDMSGTWAAFVEVGVGWQSGTIAPGAGTVRQWVLMRQVGPQFVARSCGIGAHGVPLGSPWFSTNEFNLPQVYLPSEWTGVEFLPSLFDRFTLPEVVIPVTLDKGNPAQLALGDHMITAPVAFQHGTDALSGDTPWPDRLSMKQFVIDHDADTFPGLTGIPFQGPVAGEPPGTLFADPRLGIEQDPSRTNALFMAIRNRAGLDLTLTSCDPPRFEGKVTPSTLLIETRNVACLVTQTGQPCTDDQAGFIDANLPQFEHNLTGHVVSQKVPDDTECPDVRRILRE